MITIDHVYCIAIEEMEAWLLGDIVAIKKAYPQMEGRINSKYSAYIQDSICETWEILAEMPNPRGGIRDFAKRIEQYMRLEGKKQSGQNG